MSQPKVMVGISFPTVKIKRCDYGTCVKCTLVINLINFLVTFTETTISIIGWSALHVHGLYGFTRAIIQLWSLSKAKIFCAPQRLQCHDLQRTSGFTDIDSLSI